MLSHHCQSSGRRKEGRKKEVKAVVNSVRRVITEETSYRGTCPGCRKGIRRHRERCPSHRSAQVKKPAALVPAQWSQQQEYKTIAPSNCQPMPSRPEQANWLSSSAKSLQHDHDDSKLRRFLGKVNGKPVVFSILSPDQPYEQWKAESYIIRFYPTGQTEPTVVLECKKLPSPATMEGMPRTYVGEIRKQWSNDRTRRL